MMDQLGMNLKASAGGVDRYFSGLNTTFARQGVKTRAFGFGEGPGGISLGASSVPLLRRWQAVRCQLVPRRGAMLASHFSLYALPAVLGRQWDAHVVHFHGPWAGESAREGARLHAVLLKRLLERAVYQRADRFIVLSKAFRDQLCLGYGIEESLVHVIPGGVDTDKFKLMDQAKARERLGWHHQNPVVVCVRRLARRMGLENLITAFHAVVDMYPDAKLIIGGQGPLRSELEDQVQALGLGNQVRFLGFISENDLPVVYAAADISVVPSSALEGFGLIALESLACGTPVLVTPVGGLPETVQGLSHDLVLAGTRSDDLAEGLRRWLGKSLALPSSDACREHVLSRFTWDEIASRVCEVYQETGWRPERS